MQPLYIIFTFLSSLSPVLSIECNETQYKWPITDSRLCCNKCPPGQRLNWRSESSCYIQCVSCMKNQYSDSCNVEMRCNVCNDCNKQHMTYKTTCNATHNAVCTCNTGYTCKDQSCTECVPLPATTIPTLSPSTTALTTETITTTKRPYKPVRDTVWFLVIISLLCAGIALVIVTKIKPILHWIRSKHGYFLAQKPALVPQCAEDEEVSKPVQEVCGKCDQPIDV